MINIPGGGPVPSAEIGEDYIKAFDARGQPIEETRAIDPATFGLTDDSDGAELLEARLRGVRRRRDVLLAACDWTQMPDVPLHGDRRDAWQAYRQALRDLPEQITEESMFAVQWPDPPV